MKRSEFLKRLGIGAAAVAIAPKVIAETNIPSNQTEGIIPYIKRTSTTNPFKGITVGLFKEGNEVQYKGYHRMNTSWYLERDTFKPKPVSFPMSPKERIIEADELRVFNSHNELVASVLIDACVFHGIITIQW